MDSSDSLKVVLALPKCSTSPFYHHSPITHLNIILYSNDLSCCGSVCHCSIINKTHCPEPDTLQISALLYIRKASLLAYTVTYKFPVVLGLIIAN